MTARAGVLAMSIVACTQPAPARQRGRSGARPELVDRHRSLTDARIASTGATTRATRRWWCCRAIRASRSLTCRSTTIRLAYVSVGEADPRRPYWPAVRGQPFLVEPNPEWPDNIRVDMRERALAGDPPARGGAAADEARVRRADARTPSIRPRTWRRKDPARFAGSRQALRDWSAPPARDVPARVSSPTAARRWSTPRRSWTLRHRGRVLVYDPGTHAFTGHADADGPGSWA
jgi:hypothetical protein